jgi:hypothetical protein
MAAATNAGGPIGGGDHESAADWGVAADPPR